MRAFEDRQVRLARNQSVYRDVNARTVQLSGGGDESSVQVVCECADKDCVETFPVSVQDYEAVRAQATRFLVRPGHVVAEVEDVVGEAGSYVVVDKMEAGARNSHCSRPAAMMDERTQLKGDIEALLTLIESMRHNGTPAENVALKAATLVLSGRRAQLARLDED